MTYRQTERQTDGRTLSFVKLLVGAKKINFVRLIDRITASHCLVATSPIVCFDVSVCFEIALMTLFYY